MMPSFSRRMPQAVGKFTVLTAHREFMDPCEHCGGYITKDTWYVRLSKGIAHYYCAKIEADKQAKLAHVTRPPKKPKGNKSQRRLAREKRQREWRENRDAFERAVQK